MDEQIRKLKAEKNAVILAHYYAPPEAQKVADFVGDSFYLAKVAKESKADIILFCGVLFMGESAKILNPGKKVIMPDLRADCPMAHMVSKEKILKMREKYSDLAVVCYINSSAELKCMSDVCVTSSNAVKIVRKLPQENIFFIPDRNLGSFVAAAVPEKNVILNDGYCPVHVKISAALLQNEKASHPYAQVLSHPECEDDILKLSDFVGSTAEIIDYANKSECNEFIICTEMGVEYKLLSENPDKKFYFVTGAPCCADMKLNTLENIYTALKNESNLVEIDEETSKNALMPLNRMLECAK